eukprot:TRINITY_DN11764_c0_g1_i2.p1 TRINITY_DN11764_c0_g1~~TRINITY_DN11764_c0_g1_i2.p1  ORF type:complete len:665 (+),score=87.82 TRINITY_DN11764_c0_g1_i2:242-2236(+)
MRCKSVVLLSVLVGITAVILSRVGGVYFYEKDVGEWREKCRAGGIAVEDVRAEYDVVIIGSGIAGSITALTLGSAGVSVLVVEQKQHPHFAIGESTTPSTSYGITQLGRDWDVPELETISHYLGLKTIDCPAWPKQTFWFGHHSEGEELRPERELQLDTFQLPLGPDLHMKRDCVDHFLVCRLPKYNVDYIDHTSFIDFTERENNPTSQITFNHTTSGSVFKVRARIVLDATGHAAVLGRRYKVLQNPPRMLTNTRGLFSHFRNIPPLEDLANNGQANPSHRFKRHGGTMHHIFSGGWIWVIPFDDGVTSVGLVLDSKTYPFNASISAESEFESFINRFPTVKRHLGPRQITSVPGRIFRSPGRVQFSTKQIVLPQQGVILTPHASGFVDPLFSTGLTLSSSFVSRFVRMCADAKKSGDWDLHSFADLEKPFAEELDVIDKVVAGNFQSFVDWEIFKQYWRIWAQASSMQFASKIMQRHDTPESSVQVYAAGVKAWVDLVNQMHQTVSKGTENLSDQDPDRDAKVNKVAQDLKALMDSVANQYYGSEWDIRSNRAPSTFVTNTTAMHRWLEWAVHNHAEMQRDFDRIVYVRFYMRQGIAMLELLTRQLFSRIFGTPFHRHVAFIESMRHTDYTGGYFEFPTVFSLWNRITGRSPFPKTVDLVHK